MIEDKVNRERTEVFPLFYRNSKKEKKKKRTYAHTLLCFVHDDDELNKVASLVLAF